MLIDELSTSMRAQLPPGSRIGIDLVQINRIAESLRRFGIRFERKLFTDGELGYSRAAPPLKAERLAARFAAKEAAIKALGLSNSGIGWRELEVVRLDTGECRLRLHGRAAEVAESNGVGEVLLSLTHDGEYAGAVVAALSDKARPRRSPESRS